MSEQALPSTQLPDELWREHILPNLPSRERFRLEVVCSAFKHAMKRIEDSWKLRYEEKYHDTEPDEEFVRRSGGWQVFFEAAHRSIELRPLSGSKAYFSFPPRLSSWERFLLKTYRAMKLVDNFLP